MSNGPYYSQQFTSSPQSPISEQEQFIMKQEARWKRSLVITGICLIGFIVTIFICFILFVKGDQPLDEELFNEVQAQQYSSKLPVGVQLLFYRKQQLKSLNFNVIHNDKQDTGKIYIWDIGLYEGEYVQIFADGEPLSKPFILKSKPRTLTAPTNARIEVKGIREVRNGINYGIMFSSNEKSYYNNVAEGKSNTYLLQMSN